MNDISFAAAKTVPAQLRYVNAEWKHTDEIPRIGSRETRRANTSFQDIHELKRLVVLILLFLLVYLCCLILKF